VWVTSSLAAVLRPTRIALGNFDGVHLGHQEVIRQVLRSDLDWEGRSWRYRCVSLPSVGRSLSESELYQSLTSPQREGEPEATEIGERKFYTTVVTFNPHPQVFFSGQTRSLLSPIAEKVDTLRSLGVDQLVLLPFTAELAALSPEAFVQQIVCTGLDAQAVSVGGNFRFGHRRSGTAEDLQRLCQQRQIEAHIVNLHHVQGDRVSSSAVRAALEAGELERANALLGRAYRVAGTVEQGQQLGRTIGFPTANIHLPPDKFLPKWGVYAGRVWLRDRETWMPGVLNIGCRPTVDGKRPTVEVHLINWQGNLYGHCLSIELVHFLRPEAKFASLDALKQQIHLDRDRAMQLLGTPN